MAVSNRVLKARRGERFFSPTGFINGAGGRLDSHRRTAAAVLGPLPPNRRRPGANPGPLAGFLSVRDLLRIPRHATPLGEGDTAYGVTE